MSERDVVVSGTLRLVDLTAPAQLQEPEAKQVPPSPPEGSASAPGAEWTNRSVALAVVGALAVGLLFGFLMFNEDPVAELVEARDTIGARDVQVDALEDRVGILEAELRRANPDALERAEREAALAERDQTLALREAEAAQRERELEGYWRIPKFDIPSLQDVQGLFAGFSETAETQLDTTEAVSEATRPGTG